MQLEFFIDLHSHSQQLNAFLYGNVFSDDPIRSERQAILPTLLSEIAVDYSLDLTQFNKDPVKAGTGRRYGRFERTRQQIGYALSDFRVVATVLNGDPMCYTLEVSVFGYMNKELSQDVIPYTEESCKTALLLPNAGESMCFLSDQRLGEDLAHAFSQYLEVERGARTVQMRPFHLFLANPASNTANDGSNAVSKPSLLVNGVKAPPKVTDYKKSIHTNLYVSRKTSHPGAPRERVYGKSSCSIFEQHQSDMTIEEA